MLVLAFVKSRIKAQYIHYMYMYIGVLMGGGQGVLPPPPPQKKWLRCSKLEVADQQGVVNSRS